MRDDIGFVELIALLVGTSRAVEQASWDPDVQARILAVIADGLRPPTSLTRGHPTSHPSPPS